MNGPRRDQRLLEVVEEVLDLPAREGEAKLRKLCGSDGELLADALDLLARSRRESTLRVVAPALGRLDGLADATRSLSELAREFSALIERLGRPSGRWDRYEFPEEEPLGRGGSGQVRVAFDQDLRRRVAVKFLLTDESDGRRAARFVQEAQILAQLDHPNIPPIYDLGLDPGSHLFFTMPLLSRRTLREELEEVRSVDSSRAVRQLLVACEAVAHAHARGVVHRDLKPANIVLGMNAAVFVADWGIARIEHGDDEPEVTTDLSDARGDVPSLATSHGSYIGTPPYAAPELVDRRLGDAGTWSDVYSLGAILYHVLAGFPPYFDAGQMPKQELLARLRAGEPKSIDAAAPGGAPELLAICKRAMARSPGVRYENAAHLADDLRAFLDLRVVRAYRTGALPELISWFRRNSRLALSVLTLVALAVGGVLWSSSVVRAERRAVLRLSTLEDYDDLIARADELWPPVPDLSVEWDRWLGDARELTGSLETFENDLERLQGRPRNRDDEWWHERLTELIAKLGALDSAAGLLASSDAEPVAPFGWSVPRRVAFARQLETALRPGGVHALEWSRAISAVSEDPRYAGLELEVVPGLVPLGPAEDSGLHEFWYVASGTRPTRRNAHGSWVVEEETGAILVLVPGGSFWMGADKDPVSLRCDPFAQDDERPIHPVSLSAFLIGKHEVTQGQWLRMAGENPSFYSPEYDLYWQYELHHPVEQVDWDTARRILQRFAFDLPTEAQWEYAARAGTHSRYWMGDRPDATWGAGAINFADMEWQRNQQFDFAPAAGLIDDGRAVHRPVSDGRPNGWGLVWVHGNVSEWTRCTYAPYPESRPLDPWVPPDAGDRRVSRGGGFLTNLSGCRIANRSHEPPGTADRGTGLRMTMELKN